MSDDPFIDFEDYYEQNWFDDAACRGRADLDPFSGAIHSKRKFKEVCHECPVRRLCLEHAVRHGEGLTHQVPGGIWGGAESRQLRQLTGRTARMTRPLVCGKPDCDVETDMIEQVDADTWMCPKHRKRGI